jgi:hypothetical protein
VILINTFSKHNDSISFTYRIEHQLFGKIEINKINRIFEQFSIIDCKCCMKFLKFNGVVEIMWHIKSYFYDIYFYN